MTAFSPNATKRRVHLFCYAALCASICLGVAGQLLMKGAAGITTVSISDALPQLALALAIYSLGVLNWMFALRGVNLNVAYSLSSLNYVGILLGSYYWFAEQITLLRILAVALIFVGVSLVVFRSSKRPGPEALGSGITEGTF